MIESTKDIPVICLMGTTASGKTDAAAQMSENINGEIISVDSSLVYRDMDIGTAKPDADFLKKYPHHLIDIRSANETYSVAEFYKDSLRLIERIAERGKVPILVGGTHFYFSALEKGLADLPEADSELRAKISDEAETTGWQAMHERLKAIDPVSAQRIDPMDAQRIQRALEIVLQSGKTVAEHNAHRKPGLRRPMVKIALGFSDRAYLHQRIEQRFDIMIEQGFRNEVVKLLNRGLDPNSASLKMIGYRQMLEFLQGDTTFDEMRLKAIAATRQLAKRQLTWLRNQSNTVWWVDFGLKEKDFSQLIDYVDKILR